MNRIVILPICDDGNRGDQALVWETRRISREAGFSGLTFMLSDLASDNSQSEAAGFEPISPILHHPSSRYTPSTNLRYGPLLTLVWGTIALVDFFRSVLLLTRMGRRLLRHTLPPASLKTLQTMESTDACFIKGGGFIHSTKSVADPYKAYFFLFHVYLAHSLKKPVYVMPNSFGPFDGRLYRFLVKKALVKCRLVTTRESISQAALASIGVKAELSMDSAFGLKSEAITHSPIEAIRAANPDRPIVGITARPYRFPGSKNPKAAYDKYIEQFTRFIKRLYAEGYFPVFIEHVHSSSEHESDGSAIARIADGLPSNCFSIVSQPKVNCRVLKSLYGQCDYVVGTRFHSVIFSLSEGTPALAIAYGGNKGHGIMKDLGLSSCVIDIAEFTDDVASKKLAQMVSNQEVMEVVSGVGDQARASRTRLAGMVAQLHFGEGQ